MDESTIPQPDDVGFDPTNPTGVPQLSDPNYQEDSSDAVLPTGMEGYAHHTANLHPALAGELNRDPRSRLQFQLDHWPKPEPESEVRPGPISDVLDTGSMTPHEISVYKLAQTAGRAIGSNVVSNAALFRTTQQLEKAEAQNLKLIEVSKIDKKTGLLNQDGLMDYLDKKIADGDADIACYVLDIDGFKSVNDVLGHQSGDTLLKLISEVIREVYKRKEDRAAHGSRDTEIETDQHALARLSGDEYSVVTVRPRDILDQNETSNEVNNELPSESEDRRSRVLEDEIENQKIRLNEVLRERLRNTAFEDFGIKLSIGVAVHEPGMDTMQLMGLADLKMYSEKYERKIDKFREDTSPKEKVQIREIIGLLKKHGHRIEQWLEVALEDEESS